MAAGDFSRDYQQYAEARTNAPAVFHGFAAVSVCGAALGNRVFIDTGWGRIYPSQWVCFVGRSGVRKSTAVNIAAGLLASADASIEIPHDFSREAFYEILAARPYGLLRWREMGSVLKALKRDYNAGTLETLTDFWDSPSMVKRRTKGSGEIQITYPAVSILAAAKPRWFIDNVRPEDIEGGFLSRWLLITADENSGDGTFFGRRLSNIYDMQRSKLVEHLQALAQHEGEMVPGEGAQVLESWLKAWEERGWDEENDPADLAARAGTHIVKLAMGVQACRGAEMLRELDPKAVALACQLWEYAHKSAVPLVAKMAKRGRDSEMIDKMGAAIQAHGEMTRRDLGRKFNMKPRDLDDYIAALLVSEQVRMVVEDVPGGRKITYVWEG